MIQAASIIGNIGQRMPTVANPLLYFTNFRKPKAAPRIFSCIWPFGPKWLDQTRAAACAHLICYPASRGSRYSARSARLIHQILVDQTRAARAIAISSCFPARRSRGTDLVRAAQRASDPAIRVIGSCARV